MLRDGRGMIELEFDAAVPRAAVPRGVGDRRLVFENHHQRAIAEYLVNGLVPRDPEIRLGAQHRSYDQSAYRLDYTQTGVGARTASPDSPSDVRWWLVVAALLPLLSWIAARSARRRASV